MSVPRMSFQRRWRNWQPLVVAPLIVFGTFVIPSSGRLFAGQWLSSTFPALATGVFVLSLLGVILLWWFLWRRIKLNPSLRERALAVVLALATIAGLIASLYPFTQGLTARQQLTDQDMVAT